MRKLFLTLCLGLAGLTASAGEPMLSIFKENYATTGIPLNARPDWDTNDMTFQISMKFNAFQNIGGKNWDIFFAYTQLSVWEIYKPSNPFKCNTFAPGAYIYHPFKKNKDGEVVNDLLIGIEHRSNGHDASLSRGIEYIFATYTHTFGNHFTAQLTGRFGDGSIYNDFSLEMYKYQGYVNLGLCYHTKDRRFMASVSATPLFNGDIPANVNAEIAIRPTRSNDWFYLVARYHYGYDENQLDCAVPDVFLKHMLRFGLALQPSRLSHKLFF